MAVADARASSSEVVRALEHYHAYLVTMKREDGEYKALAEPPEQETRSLSEYSPTSRVQTKQNRYIMFYAKGLPNLPS